MEYGLIPRIDQYSETKNSQIQKVQSTPKTSKIETDEELERYQEDLNAKSRQENLKQYEVVLTNLNFGYNKASNDFFVKVKRGEYEGQYPTEQMMRAKAEFIKNQVENQKKD